MPYGNKHTENELATEALRVLAAAPSGSAPFRQLIPAIGNGLTLLAGDTKPSSKRLGEQMWEQRVRNITSHKKTPSNFIYRGLLASVPDGLRITAQGHAYLAKRP